MRIKAVRTAKTGPGIGATFSSTHSGNAGGVVIDGATYALEGEPPQAQTKGWGIVPGWLPRAWR